MTYQFVVRDAEGKLYTRVRSTSAQESNARALLRKVMGWVKLPQGLTLKREKYESGLAPAVVVRQAELAAYLTRGC